MMTLQQKNEYAARVAFEFWAGGGTKPFMYPLDVTAGGEYASPFTEYAWRAFFAGWIGLQLVTSGNLRDQESKPQKEASNLA